MTTLAAKIRTALAGRSQHLLDVLGLGLLGAAAGVLHLSAGLAVGGVAALALNWRLHGSE